MIKLTIILFVILSTIDCYADTFGNSFSDFGPRSAYELLTNKNKFVGFLSASDMNVQQALETLSYIAASSPSITGNWDFGSGNLELPNNTICPTVACDEAGEAGRICIDTDATSGQQIYGCEGAIGWILQGDGGAGGGDNIRINGTNATDADFSDSSPTIPASGIAVRWQRGSETFNKVSGYAAINTSSILSVALTDETGSAELVFASNPTIYLGAGRLTIPQDTTCPSFCGEGEICYDTNATSGQRIYACQSGVWTLQGDGGAGGAPTDADYLVGTTNASLSAEIVVGTTPGGELGGTWGTPTIDETGIALTSITIGALLGVDSIDATGAVDMDYGSADVTDHTFITDGTTDGDFVVPLTSIGAGEIVLDTITHAQILDADQADTKCIWFEDPTAADDFLSIWSNRTANAFQVTEIWAESDQTVTFMLQLDDGSAADCDTVDLAPAAGTAEDTSLDGDCLVSADEQLDLATTSVANTPTYVSICWTGNWVDD